MTVGNVSFGSVVAVSGKPKIMKKFDNVMRRHEPLVRGQLMSKDVTQHYKNQSSTGLMAQSAQKGEPVEIFIMGQDLVNVMKQKDGWDTLDGILSNLSSFMVINKMPAESVAESIVQAARNEHALQQAFANA